MPFGLGTHMGAPAGFPVLMAPRRVAALGPAPAAMYWATPRRLGKPRSGRQSTQARAQ